MLRVRECRCLRQFKLSLSLIEQVLVGAGAHADKPVRAFQGRKQHDSQRRDKTLRDLCVQSFRYFLQILGGPQKNFQIKLEKMNRTGEFQNIQLRLQPKSQISVSCRGRTCRAFEFLGTSWKFSDRSRLPRSNFLKSVGVQELKFASGRMVEESSLFFCQEGDSLEAPMSKVLCVSGGDTFGPFLLVELCMKFSEYLGLSGELLALPTGLGEG